VRKRKLLFSVTKKNLRWDYFRGSGAGGQKRNKTENCCRCTHEPSGAVGKSEEGRSKEQNRKKAFRRMAESKEFQQWTRIEAARAMGTLIDIDKKVEQSMMKITVEVVEDGKWVVENG